MRELEEELKLLKAEVKSVLLDLREVMLARANPLVHGLPSEEAGGGEVAEVGQNGGAEAAASAPHTPHKEGGDGLHQGSMAAPAHQGSAAAPAHHASWDGREAGVGGDIVAWVLKAMQQLGPQRVEHLLAMYRLLKPLPPNVERALAHLQELVRSSPEAMPSWLVALRELDRLASPS